MRRNPLQPTFPIFDDRPVVFAGGREAVGYTPWPKEHREAEMSRAVAEAVAAMLFLGSDRATAERLPRIVESAVLASASGPSGANLLEEVDRALVRVRGRDHGLLDGKYL